MPPEEIERLRESLRGLGEDVIKVSTEFKLHADGANERHKEIKSTSEKIIKLQEKFLEEIMAMKNLCGVRGVNYKLFEQHLDEHREEDKTMKNLLKDKVLGLFVAVIVGIIGVFIGKLWK